MPPAEHDPGSRAQHEPDADGLCARATVSLRWWPVAEDDAWLTDMECAAGLRALQACLEGEGGKTGAMAAARLEAKIDLALVKLERLAAAVPGSQARGGQAPFLPCEVLLRPDSIEWNEARRPLPPGLPPDGTSVFVELRAAAGHPVTTLLRATLARRASPPAPPGAPATRLVATLDPMPPELRDTFERCVFILHRLSVRRSHGGPGGA